MQLVESEQELKAVAIDKTQNHQVSEIVVESQANQAFEIAKKKFSRAIDYDYQYSKQMA